MQFTWLKNHPPKVIGYNCFEYLVLICIIAHTFGYHRAEVIAALVSVLTIWVLTGILVKEAIERLRSPQEINAKLVRTISTFHEGKIITQLKIDVYHSIDWCSH